MSEGAPPLRTWSDRDAAAVEAYRNFLGWGWAPHQPRINEAANVSRRHGPPAVWAYLFGASTWCPPKGEL